MNDGDLTQVSHEQDGRILTGIGVDAADLAETMERHAPDPDASATRNDQGQFTKKTRGQKRFDELTGQREAAERERDKYRTEADDLRRQLEDARRTPAPSRETVDPSTTAQSVSAAVSASADPASDFDFPEFDQWLEQHPSGDYSKWQRALLAAHADYTVKKLDIDARIRQSIEADRASRTRADHVSKAVERGRTAYHDFDAVLNAPHMTVGNWPDEKIAAIARLEAPEHIQYALGKDPALAERLRTADPVTFGMELAKLITPAAVASPASTARVVVPPPPAPMQPVAGGGRTSVPSAAEMAEASDDYDKSGYRQRRASERGVKSRF